jgi:coenzyme F420-reducing hydrogenase delta subunit
MSRLSNNHQWSINLVNTKTDDFQIVAYCCTHCAYAAADLAGGLRMQYPPSIKVVELPCTGRLDILMVLESIERGADGVMVSG